MKTVTALGAASLAGTAGAAARAYDPTARLPIRITEVPFRRNSAGRQLMARIYQPEGEGPFPVLLDLHGGAWSRKDRLANEPMDRAIAAGGMLVVAIDLTLSGEAPYPANVLDASYGIRWLKWKAREWKGEPSTLGVLGSSSGGHVSLLLALRPRDARYNSIPLTEAPALDTTFGYLATRAPVSDPYARFLVSQKASKDDLVKASQAYFSPFENIHEGNPQEILDRREKVSTPPLLIMHGGADDHVLPANQKKFADAYRAAGGDVQFMLFDGAEHEWVAKPGPQTDRAHEVAKAFISRQLKAARNA
ncbi:MAG: alpha/beta hydrolase [Betaproteobacteria bacterium]|nr:alpha/beta hydrolase [Betaproteobacteria bacterium]